MSPTKTKQGESVVLVDILTSSWRDTTILLNTALEQRILTDLRGLLACGRKIAVVWKPDAGDDAGETCFV
jgi:hypothetical protein